ncbi:MAG TPA: hypothetical protein VHE33_08130 [Acidobacteriaceae bacterium]|nr:hypothetical protein [Acidobacteriaceae bacterium]
MKHLNEEELIELYYGESNAGNVAHLAGCQECSVQMAELKKDLEGARMAVPERGAEYGEQVWQELRPRLIPYEKRALGWRGFFGKSGAQWKVAVIAVGCAALVAAAFLGGRVWERHQKTNVAGGANPEVKQRVVLVVLTDHLDRTERLLVSLEHANSSDRVENAQLQSEARELLASNRLYRTTATNAGDPVLAGALDKLQGVLAEVANDPNLTAADLERLRSEMNTEGILFEIRVLRARGAEEMSGQKSAKGAAI